MYRLVAIALVIALRSLVSMSLGLDASVISTMALVPQPNTEKLYQELDCLEEKL